MALRPGTSRPQPTFTCGRGPQPTSAYRLIPIRRLPVTVPEWQARRRPAGPAPTDPPPGRFAARGTRCPHEITIPPRARIPPPVRRRSHARFPAQSRGLTPRTSPGPQHELSARRTTRSQPSYAPVTLPLVIGLRPTSTTREPGTIVSDRSHPTHPLPRRRRRAPPEVRPASPPHRPPPGSRSPCGRRGRRTVRRDARTRCGAIGFATATDGPLDARVTRSGGRRTDRAPATI